MNDLYCEISPHPLHAATHASYRPEASQTILFVRVEKSARQRAESDMNELTVKAYPEKSAREL